MTQSLGELMIIKKNCLQCSKPFEAKLQCDLFCSMGCVIEFREEAALINHSYNWVLKDGDWLFTDKRISMRCWSQ